MPATLAAAIADDARAVEEHERRRAMLVAELLTLRRSVDDAVADLHGADPERDPTARLRGQVAELRAASDEARREAGQRARLSGRVGQP